MSREPSDGWDSVVSHNREGSELAQFGLILPLPLLVRVAWLVKLLGQVSEDFMHFRVVDDLGGRREEVSRGCVLGHPAPTALHPLGWFPQFPLLPPFPSASFLN